MDWLVGFDWKEIFIPHTSLLEIFVRGTIMYLALFTLLRITNRRGRGGIGTTDVLVIVLIADAAQNGMAGDYTSIPDGVLLVVVIVGWSVLLDWIAFKSPVIAGFVKPPPRPLYRNGRLLTRNMSREYITEDELMEQLRIKGVHSLDQVDTVLLEGEGEVSVVRKEEQNPPEPDTTT